MKCSLNVISKQNFRPFVKNSIAKSAVVKKELEVC